MNYNFEELATRYGLTVEIVTKIHDLLHDKSMLEKALRMFNAGTLPYDVATGDTPFDLAAIRHQIAVNLIDLRKNRRAKAAEMMAKQKAIVEYYNTCKMVKCTHKVGKPARIATETAFIDPDCHLVALGHYEAKDGGIYCANNPVMPEHNWSDVHKHLGVFRKNLPRFYKDIKRAATGDFNSDLFKFDQKTIRK